MQTLSLMFRALAYVLHQLWLAAQEPRTMKLARINLYMWGAVSGCAALALVTDAIAASYHGTFWSWWYLWNGTILFLDLAMFRAALLGYFYRKAEDAEAAEFDRIVAGL